MTDLSKSETSKAQNSPINIEQNIKGNHNQIIGQIHESIIVYVNDGQAIIQTSPSKTALVTTSEKDISCNPYQGLQAFEEEDFQRFFGRDIEIDQLWRKLRSLHERTESIRFLPIYGPSGSGKSSLVRAGLIPKLADPKYALPGYAQVRVAVLVPGTHPLESLAGVLARTFTNDPLPITKITELVNELKEYGDLEKYDRLRFFVDMLPNIANSPLIIFVDQFEEVYSLCQSSSERKIFIENLITAAKEASQRVFIIINLRSDFLSETQQHPALSHLFSEQGYLIPAMSESSLRMAISKPAENAGHPLDLATVNLLIEQSRAREGSLPLLQFALTRIWDGIYQNVEPAITLERIDGVGGALAKEAERIFDELNSENEKDIAKRVFLGLIHLGEGTPDTRRRVPIKNLVANKDDPEHVKSVINRFASRGVRLLTISDKNTGTESVEVTHEALFQYWARLKKWLNINREDLRFNRRLEAAVQNWIEQDKPNGSLWRPPDLDLLSNYYHRASEEMTVEAAEFYQVSTHAFEEAELQQKKQKNRLIATLSIGLVVSLTTTVVAIYFLQQAERGRMRQYAVTAQLISDSDPHNSIVNSLAAISIGNSWLARFPNLKSPLVSAENLLQNSINRSSEIISIQGHKNAVTSVSLSPDGKTIASGSTDGTVKLWDLQGNLVREQNIIEIVSEKREHAKRKNHEVYALSFSPDGRFLAIGDGLKMSRSDYASIYNVLSMPESSGQKPSKTSLIYPFLMGGALYVWDLTNNSVAISSSNFNDHFIRINSLEFSPDGKLLTTVGEGGQLKLWQINSNNRKISLKNYPPLLVTEKGVKKISWRSNEEVFGNPLKTLAHSPKSKVIALGGENNTILLWKYNTTANIYSLSGDFNVINSLIFSPNGEIIIAGDESGKVFLWDFNSNELRSSFRGHSLGINVISYSPSKNIIATGSSDGMVKIWDLDGNLIGNPFQGHRNSKVNSLEFISDGKKIISGDENGRILIWEVEAHPIVTSIQGHNNEISSLAFSPDGSILASTNKLTKSWVAGDRLDNFSRKSNNNTDIRLWNMNGKLVGGPYEAPVHSVTFSPDGKVVAGIGAQGVWLWDLEGNSIGNPQDGYKDLKIDLDGKVITGMKGDQAWLEFQEKQITLSSVKKNDLTRTSLALSDKYSIDTIDSSIYIADSNGNHLGEPLVNAYTTVTPSPDGKVIAIGQLSGQILLWHKWPWRGWLAESCARVNLLGKNELTRNARDACNNYRIPQRNAREINSAEKLENPDL